MITNTIGQSVKRLRIKSGISLSKLAEKSELSLAYISKLESGKYQTLTLTTSRALAVGLGLTLKDFLEKIGFLEKQDKYNPLRQNSGLQLIASALRSHGYTDQQARNIVSYAKFIKSQPKDRD